MITLEGNLPAASDLTGTLGVTVVGGGAVSFIGMIVQSTTLDTMDKVIALYGGIEWTKIEGKFLLGSSQDHVAGSTGGSEDAYIPEHTHESTPYEGTTGSTSLLYATDISTGTRKLTYATGSVSATVVTSAAAIKESVSHSHTLSVENPSGNVATPAPNSSVLTDGLGANMPPYKTVYIWERTA